MSGNQYGRRSASQAKLGGTPQWTKSNGFVNLKAKQDDIYNSGMPGENPFQSMYQATISAQGAQRAQTAYGGRTRTPTQNRSKLQPNSTTKMAGASRSAAKMQV